MDSLHLKVQEVYNPKILQAMDHLCLCLHGRRTFILTESLFLTETYNFFLKRMTDEEKNKFFRDFIFWQQGGLDITNYHCLFINYGANVKFENPHIRSVIVRIYGNFLNF